ncbi:related to arsenic resistance protein ArsH [Phialocephala subalpina]|uniref:Related to arsenic resistance protein ArsH n=1 Tax=Phialocephala subalpina TaxID=576137 RepID=A0A1L7WFS4_9HELO|nr:related to arsenic resistance protein ArsH [Phialocephala subalpina]
MGSILPPTRSLRTLAEAPKLAISESEDDAEIRAKYRPFLLSPETEEKDWISELELDAAISIAEADLAKTGSRLKVLVLYGSLRKRSYSKLMAFEACRILHRLGCDVRLFNPSELPIRDSVPDTHRSVQELRSLSSWSDGHVWITPEQHGNLTAVFKNQIDWIPLATGSIRPTQGKHSSLPMAWKAFEDEGGDGDGTARLLKSGNRDRVVDCMEEFVKFTVVMRPLFEGFGDRFSERMERREKAESQGDGVGKS